MTNVLPKETLKFVWEGYRSRLILAGALVLVAAAAVASMTLLPAHVAIQVGQDSDGKRSADLERTGLDPQTEAERKEISRARALLVRTAPIISATSSPSEILGSVLALRPPGVTVEKIYFASEGGGSITLKGNSGGRESINQYREALSKEKYLDSVSVPVGALVGSEGGEFTVTLTGNF